MINQDVTALVLAGGRARRMGGEDKGLIEVGGRAMVQWVTTAMASQCASVMVNANRNLERYHELTQCRVVTDIDDDFAGPLAGMIAGLSSCHTPLLACVPCDSPLVAADLVDRLRKALIEQDAELAVADDGERMQPVFVLLKRELLGSMQAFVQDGGRKIDAWYQQHSTARATFTDRSEMFDNINTPEQRDALHARLSERASEHAAKLADGLCVAASTDEVPGQ
ncbi:MAG: molybdenum cofactor guanylyltransferase [Gammaproteobacteria bacterium]|jgi:molybdenum cofactor guanylyltransferase